jgi:prepilin-type N-terminal cleavage/methylation domain-containing protein
MKQAFTLLELLVVMIVLGVLATLGITHYGGIREMALEREARANLQLLRAAQRSYFMDTGSYYPANTTQQDDIGLINQNLKLSLTVGANRQWNYVVFGQADGCVEAIRNLPPPQDTTWSQQPNAEESLPGHCHPHP